MDEASSLTYQKSMDKRMSTFIQEQKNLTLCTAVNNEPYCASCFYAFISEENMLVFKSSGTTQHILNALANNLVAGTIVPDVRKVGEIIGAQFSGQFAAASGDILNRAKKVYYGKNPMALVIKGELWTIRLTNVKLTDNTLGFGSKLSWER